MKLLKLFYNLKIRTKMISSFLLVNILFGLLIILFLIMFNRNTAKAQEAYNNYGTVAYEAALSSSGYQEALSNVNKAIVIEDAVGRKEAIGAATEAMEELKTVLSGMAEKIKDTELKQQYAAADAAADAASQDINNAIEMLDGGKLSDAAALVGGQGFSEKCAALETAFANLHENAAAKGSTKLLSLQHTAMMVFVVIVIFAVIVLGISAVMVYMLSKSVKNPVFNMRDAAELMAEGDVNAEITVLGKDELGDLAQSLIKMQEKTRAQAEIAREISEGNLDLSADSRGEKDVLGCAMETMISEENRVMGGIREAVMEIKTGSQEVASASQSLAQGSTEQASAIQQITASISDITERTRVNANDANTANKLVLDAKADASESNSKMQEMIVAMADINRSSENISKIIKVIDDIAFQTNILALNAAVEAARAGQHGRGFAVVADEVRNLAGKSAQAASETAELIEDSIVKVEKGSKLAEETASALDAIVQAIDKIVTITNSIAVASNDQATAIQQIDAAIGQVSQVVQTNSATSEECAAASEELSAQAAKLRDMISRYKLKAGSSFAAGQPTAPAAGYGFGGLENDDEEDFRNDVPPVISLDDGYGKY